MKKDRAPPPHDIDEDVWAATETMPQRFPIDLVAGQAWDIRNIVARKIMTERDRTEAEVADMRRQDLFVRGALKGLRSLLELHHDRKMHANRDDLRLWIEAISVILDGAGHIDGSRK